VHGQLGCIWQGLSLRCVGQGTNEVTNAFTKQVSDNVIQRFDQGPVGLTSPSVNNVKNFYKKKMKYVKK
jgi:hypothetical protein